MSDTKKLTIKRLVIFYAISFVPLCVVMAVLKAVYGENLYASERVEVALAAQLAGFAMFLPAAAVIITRLVTKEGFSNSYLGLNLKGNLRYYLVSVLLKPIEAVLGVWLLCLVFFRGQGFGEIFAAERFSGNLAAYVLQLACSIIVFFPAFGEEWGWRGYMMPKLTELMGKPAAVIVGGILWGLWHAPMTVQGHNFGVDYAGFPFLGIAVMCLFCTAMNALLTLLTERTGSIYPASFCHMINNNCGAAAVTALFMTEEAYRRVGEINALTSFLCTCGFTLVIGAVSFVLLLKKNPSKVTE